MAEPRKFIDLTEVFYESVKVGRDYERQPRLKGISIPVDHIAKIEDADYSGGVKAMIVMKTGNPIYTQDDRAGIKEKIAPPPAPGAKLTAL
jgi:hypothetical protein